MILARYSYDYELNNEMLIFPVRLSALPRVGDDITHRVTNDGKCGTPFDDWRDYETMVVCGRVKAVRHYTEEHHIDAKFAAYTGHSIMIEIMITRMNLARHGEAETSINIDPEFGREIHEEIRAEQAAAKQKTDSLNKNGKVHRATRRKSASATRRESNK